MVSALPPSLAAKVLPKLLLQETWLDLCASGPRPCSHPINLMLVTQAHIQLFTQLQPSLPEAAPQPFLVPLHTPLPTQAQDTGLGSLHLSLV